MKLQHSNPIQAMLIFALLLVLLSGCAGGNTEITLSVNTTSDGKSLAGVWISLTPQNENIESRLQSTDANGSTIFTIDAGTYLLSASKEGYSSEIIEREFAESGELNVELKPISGAGS